MNEQEQGISQEEPLKPSVPDEEIERATEMFLNGFGW